MQGESSPIPGIGAPTHQGRPAKKADTRPVFPTTIRFRSRCLAVSLRCLNPPLTVLDGATSDLAQGSRALQALGPGFSSQRAIGA